MLHATETNQKLRYLLIIRLAKNTPIFAYKVANRVPCNFVEDFVPKVGKKKERETESVPITNYGSTPITVKGYA